MNERRGQVLAKSEEGGRENHKQQEKAVGREVRRKRLKMGPGEEEEAGQEGEGGGKATCRKTEDGRR